MIVIKNFYISLLNYLSTFVIFWQRLIFIIIILYAVTPTIVPSCEELSPVGHSCGVLSLGVSTSGILSLEVLSLDALSLIIKKIYYRKNNKI